MPRHVLYAYVDGADLEGIASAVEVQFRAFVTGRRWVAGNAWVVNQRRDQEHSPQPGDLPPWDLGLNLELPDPGAESRGWFKDVEVIARFLGRFHAEFGRDFVIGIADTDTSIADDLFVVSTAFPNLKDVRTIIGVGDTE